GGPYPLSLADAREARAAVTLSTGEVVTRSIRLTKEDEVEKLEVNNRRVHPAFGVSPFVLRRSDLLRLIEAPETKGQLVFKDFFQRPTATEWMETPDEALRRLDDERLERKRHRREL